MNKKSIRFFNDREVRAVWDDTHAKWWFSARGDKGSISHNESSLRQARNQSFYHHHHS